MTRPRIIRYVAPPTTPPRGPANGGIGGAMTVDYADVLRQAVANERFRILREIRNAVENVRTTEKANSYSSYASRDRGGEAVKRDVQSILERLEQSS